MYEYKEIIIHIMSSEELIIVLINLYFILYTNILTIGILVYTANTVLQSIYYTSNNNILI